MTQDSLSMLKSVGFSYHEAQKQRSGRELASPLKALTVTQLGRINSRQWWYRPRKCYIAKYDTKFFETSTVYRPRNLGSVRVIPGR